MGGNMFLGPVERELKGECSSNRMLEHVHTGGCPIQDRLSGTLPTEPVAIRFEPITAPHVQSQPESSWSDAGEAELVHAIKHAAAENAA